MLTLKAFSSLYEIFPTGELPAKELTTLTALQNEQVSFQVAYRVDKSVIYARFYNPRLSGEALSLYAVDNVPVVHTASPGLENPPAPGLYPDILSPKQVNPEIVKLGSYWTTRMMEPSDPRPVSAYNDCWQLLWVTFNEKGETLAPGSYPITLEMQSADTGEIEASVTVTVEVMAAELPEQSFMCTNWFHYDCLCDYYGVEPFSERFNEITDDFIQKATQNGMNMLLVPTFTPPLDTRINGRRRIVQLVDITVENGVYTFDFDRLSAFLDRALACGVTYFEHAHLFTQWGATSAPSIWGEKDGEFKELFGWSTDAGGEEYTTFLHAYIPALRALLREKGLEKRMLFHISDEPVMDMIPTFSRALAAVGDLLDGCLCGDAMSEFSMYEKGYVKTPIVATNHIQPFLGNCENLWCYYTGEQIEKGYSNRLLTVSRLRNRFLGVTMYYHNIRGFLHWGYNYYYTWLSLGMVDPNLHPGCYVGDSGTSFLVYPSHKGTALQSIRQKIFNEGLLDLRALQLLEQKKGRAFCEQLIEQHIGKPQFDTCIDDLEQLIALRDAVNRALNV